jgi:hypothetical protein
MQSGAQTGEEPCSAGSHRRSRSSETTVWIRSTVGREYATVRRAATKRLYGRLSSDSATTSASGSCPILSIEPTVSPLYSALTPRRDFNADLLLTYLVQPGTALYLGLNSDECRGATEVQARQVFVKVSYLFRR